MVDVQVDPEGIGGAGDLVTGWASMPRAAMTTAEGCMADDVVAASADLAASVTMLTDALAAAAGEHGSGAGRVAQSYAALDAAVGAAFRAARHEASAAGVLGRGVR